MNGLAGRLNETPGCIIISVVNYTTEMMSSSLPSYAGSPRCQVLYIVATQTAFSLELPIFLYDSYTKMGNSSEKAVCVATMHTT